MATEPCPHYGRRCHVLAECCKQWVGCRLCHDAQFEDHAIDRHAIRQMRCDECQTAQPCAQDCANCHRRMAAYFCSVCNLFDDAGPEKKIFHCAQCGICRVGGRENFYHCVKCCGCYPHSIETMHRCLEGSMHRECPICLDVTFDSLESVNVLPCGHVMHVSCFKEYLKHRNIVCPTCRTLMFTEDEMNGTADGSEDEEEEEDSESEEDAEEGERLGAADDDSDSDSEVDTDSDASSTAADDAEHNVWPAGHRAV